MQDDELWVENGDCLVHFYARGTSRRGASLRIPLAKLQDTGSHYLLRECLYKSPSSSDEDDYSDSGYAPSTSSDHDSHCSELYIPAPVELSRQEAFSYHIGTRNYFAYLLEKPIVGENSGLALAHLWQRIQAWQRDDLPVTAFRAFCQERGYSDFAGNLDYAAAALYWSEHARVKEIWIDAFVHCVGMHDHPEREEKMKMLSTSTRRLLHQASLDLHLNVSQATKSLGTFLEEELGSQHVGLSKPAREHLDRFRSTLHSFYVEQFGYFPPGRNEPWDKRMWARIYNDFHCLYKYLADTSSSDGMTNNHGLTGGICVTQNVKAFDESHGYSPLKHPLPLMPEISTRRRTFDARSGLGSFSKGRGETEANSLTQAANSSSRRVMTNALVRAYIHLERHKLAEKITIAEARKVRWLLVYGVLQTLIRVTKAPQEVRDTETPSYPLCVSIEDCPPWAEHVKDIASIDQPTAHNISVELDMVATSAAVEDVKISIQPDCEAETAEDYFSSGNSTRRNSSMSASMTPPPLRPAPPSRTSSIRSGVTSLRRSMVGSLSRRNSHMSSTSTISPPAIPSQPGRYSEILIEGYGNGNGNGNGADVMVNSANFSTPRPYRDAKKLPDVSSHHLSTTHPSRDPAPSTKPQIHKLNTLVEHSACETQLYVSPATSHASSAAWSASSSPSSSSPSQGPESPGTELSEGEAMEAMEAMKTESVLGRTPAEEFQGFDFGLPHVWTGATGGCEGEGVLLSGRTSVFGERERKVSGASSVYPEGSVQAADIEVEEFRGRRW